MSNSDEKIEEVAISPQPSLVVETKSGDTIKDPKLQILRKVSENGRLFGGESDSEDSDIDEYDFEDETLIERVIALKEMFPVSFRNKVHKTSSFLWWTTTSFYEISRNVTWIGVCIATLCFLPLGLELERQQLEEQEAVQQRTMMLGPQVASGSSNLAGFSATLPSIVSVPK